MSTWYAVDLQAGDIVIGEAVGIGITVKDMQQMIPHPWEHYAISGYTFPIEEGVVVCQTKPEIYARVGGEGGPYDVYFGEGMNYTFFFVAPSTATYLFMVQGNGGGSVRAITSAILIKQVPA